MARYEVEFDPDGPQDLTIVGHGVSRPGDWNDFVVRLMRDPRFRPNMTILGDFTRVTSTEMPMSGVLEIGRKMSAVEDDWGSASFAAVVPDTLTFGYVRAAMLSGDLRRLEVYPTYSIDDALAWLVQRLDPAPAGVDASDESG